MNDTDRKLLNIVQKDFPICENPYQVIGEKIGLSEVEVLERLQSLKEQGIVRRIGGVFDSKKLGYKSCLIAVRVTPEMLEEVAAFINRFPGVTHNYQRTHPFNLWFTLTSGSDEKFDEIINLIKNRSGVEQLELLPAIRMFQTEVTFKL